LMRSGVSEDGLIRGGINPRVDIIPKISDE